MAVDPSMPVLVVDDYKTMVEIIQNLVRSLGFKRVDGALSGEAALAKIAKTRYGLVISDWNMEPMSGLDLLQRLRSDAKTRSLPFIMVTAESKKERVVIAQKAGVNGYVIKPFNAETLKRKMVAALGEF